MTAPRTIVRILSDLHAGPGNPAAEAAALVRSWPHDERTHSIVLNGDTFEGWAYSPDAVPPTMAEVVAACPDLCDALREAAMRVGIFLVVGNHDAELTQDALDDVLFPNAPIEVPLRRPRVVSCFRSGRLLIEHGHRDAMFCAPDPVADPAHRRPLGYWLCRMLAGKAPHVTLRLLHEVVEEAGQLLSGRDTLAESIVDAAAAPGRLMPDSCISMPGWNEARTVKNVRDRYFDLRPRWCRQVGMIRSVDAIRADLGMEDSLRWAMQRRAEDGYAVVVTGHTHAASLHRTPGGSVLVNAGAFGIDGLHDRVEVEKRGVGRYATTLYDGDRIIGAGETP